MSRKWKGSKKTTKSSPVLFEDEEMGTTSTDDVKAKSSATPHSKRFTDHSTPIGNKVAVDSPELNYNESPIIEPLTQHPPTEVGWDYRQLVKGDEDGSPQILMDIGTPKRNTNHLLSKKRNSNSPLLYKPVKKKLIQEQQRESMEDFMNVLKQIETTAKQKKDNDVVCKKTDTSAESQLIVDMEVASDDSDIKLQVSANTNESPGQVKNEVVQTKNIQTLLDDSIEDMMVLCSQEVEAKEFGVAENQKVPALYTVQEISSETSRNKSLETLFKSPAKENIQPSISNDKVINVSDVSSKNSSKSSKSESFPDDSFDDFFVAIDEKDLCQNKEILLNEKTVKMHSKPPTVTTEDTAFKSSEPQKKFFKGTVYSETKSVTTNNYVKTQNAKVFVQTKVINENASYGYLNKDYMKNSSGSVFNSGTQKNATTNGARLFKAKSFSDSNFFQKNHHQAQNFDRSQSNLNVNSTHFQKQQMIQGLNQNSEGYGSASSSSENKGWRRTNSSSSIGYTQMSSVNRLSNSEDSQSTSTPAEIERKRQEAIARRQKKMNNAAQRRPIKR